MQEKRSFSRLECAVPVLISDQSACFHSVDVSEGGMCLNSFKTFPLYKSISLNISMPSKVNITKKARIRWVRYCVGEDSYQYGVVFEDGNITNADKENIASSFGVLDRKFVSLTIKIQKLLIVVMNRLNEFSEINKGDGVQNLLIENSKKEIFMKLTEYFDAMWEIVKRFDREQYLLHRAYYKQMIGVYMLDPIEINKHIQTKPLGYAGDFMIMNYIYDYHSGNYLGDNSFEKLINNYTCNIDISCSNIHRKDYFKEKILKVLNNNSKSRIFSVACGPAREIIELLIEDRIDKSVHFTCLDIEKKALDYIQNEISKIPISKRKFIEIELQHKNIVSLIKESHRQIDDDKKYNFIYVSGLFDYLSLRLSIKIVDALYNLLKHGGELVVCNADAENMRHRVYYEMLGEWELLYKTKEEIVSLTKNLKNVEHIGFANMKNNSNYIFLEIRKDK